MVNGLDGDGAVQNYFNSSMSQEMVYTTSGAAADVSGGGVRLNMIPSDGGNTFNGSVFVGYQNKSFQTDNLTDELKARGLRSADGIDKLSNFEGVARRPDQEGQDLVLRCRRARSTSTRCRPTSSTLGPARDAAPLRHRAGVDPQSINSAQARIIWQISQKNKLSVYNDRLGKNRGAAMTAGFDPATASHRLELADLHDRRRSKLTSTLTQQAPGRGWLLDQLRALQHPLPARHREGARHAGVVHARSTSRTSALGTHLERRARRSRAVSRTALRLPASVSYVTGAHNIKVGIQDSWGRYRRTRSANGDLRAFFQNGVRLPGR